MAAGRRRPRLVAIGFCRPATGLERVMARVLDALAEDFDVDWLGLGHRGAPVVAGAGWTLHETNVGGGDVFAVESGRALVDELDADVVLLYNDLWLIDHYRRTLADVRARVVAYLPLDGRFVSTEPLASVSWVDDLVVFTDFARCEVERSGMPPVHVIGHGVDDVGFGTVDRGAARAAALPAGWGDDFVVLNANRLQPRKRIDLTVDAFALFAASRPSTRLVLHHALEGLNDEAELEAHLARLDPDIARRVHLSRGALSVDALNLLYNASDVGVNTAAGEGWGLVAFEHALAGVAQVVPGHSSCAELWAGAASVVAPASTGVPPFSMLEMAEVAPADVAAALARMHDDPAHRQELAAAGSARAREARFTWSAVGRQWRDLLA